MRRTDARRYGRELASILRTLEAQSHRDAERLREQLDAYELRLSQERQFRARRVRAGLGLARGTLENLLANNARPVHGGALVVIDGGRPV